MIDFKEPLFFLTIKNGIY